MSELKKGVIYFKEKWFVRYNDDNIIKRIDIREEDCKNFNDPYSQAHETCFEIINNEAKLWSTSQMVRDLQKYLEETPQEIIDEEWESTKIYDEPTHNETIYSELEMIPKKYMETGWYNGICRNNHIAYWNSKEDIFYYLKEDFSIHMEKINHFEDVKDLGTDGFIPIEKIERFDFYELQKLKIELGY